MVCKGEGFVDSTAQWQQVRGVANQIVATRARWFYCGNTNNDIILACQPVQQHLEAGKEGDKQGAAVLCAQVFERLLQGSPHLHLLSGSGICLD